MYKLLVIDDAIDDDVRSGIYNFIFKNNFEYDKILNNSQLINESLKNSIYDCIILDNNLDIGSPKDEVVEIINKFEIPIIQVSGARDFNISDWNIPFVIDCISLQPYILLKNLLHNHSKDDDIIDLTKAVDITILELKRRIEKCIYSFAGYDSCKENKKTIIYHIADLQFGDKNANAIDVNSFFPKLKTNILGRTDKPDLIAIAGDIVYTGRSDEYSKVKDAIIPFLFSVFGKNTANRLLLVPGNHDFNCNCFMLDENSEKFELNENGELKIKSFYNDLPKGNDPVKNNINLKAKDFNKFDGSDNGLYEFSKFAYELTQNYKYFTYPFYISNKQLLNNGFEIIGISNAYKFFKNEPKSIRYEFEYNLVSNKINQSKNYKILVGHLNAESLGYMQACNSISKRCNKNYDNECAKEGCQKWGEMERLMNDINAVIYLHGHGHYSNFKITKDESKLFISAGSPSGLNNSEKTINILEIENFDESIELKLIVNKCTFKGIEYFEDYKFTFSKKIRKWIQLEK